ncbi:hypothetical protein [Rhodococcus sp. NCIMB 12038]|uniref:hypothetical protein n=1 Tax=Rhodococcus sp. NCIMB 12038 TaxID=933800 RepID=UPI00117B2413|nr:hypothetical protein [Rhodococcus sp. NCIMB 12038]
MKTEWTNVNSHQARGCITAEQVGYRAPDADLVRAIDHAQRRFEEIHQPGDANAVELDASHRSTRRRDVTAAVFAKLGLADEFEAIEREWPNLPKMPDRQESTTYDFSTWHFLNATGIGQLWWGRTNWWPLPGTDGYWRDGEGLNLDGQMVHHSGDLWKGSFRILAQFGLEPNRMPTTGAGRYRSSPTIDLMGSVLGWTGWTWGDDWSKCWLVATQTVRGGPGGGIAISSTEARNLIFLAGSNDRRAADLPGNMPMPRVEFQLDVNNPLTIDLEIKLDLQLEGHSGFWFGNERIFFPALLRTHQWLLEPL